MYIYSSKTNIRRPDQQVVHSLMVNPESEKDRMTACGLIVHPDWLSSLRDTSCEECKDRYENC